MALFQRSVDRFLRRLSDTTSHWSPDKVREVVPLALPVYLLGEDRTDEERATYSAGGVTSGAGLGRAELAAVDGDVELLSVTVAPENAGFVAFGFELTSGFSGSSPLPGSCAGASNAQFSVGSGGAPGSSWGLIRAQAAVALTLPLGFTLLEQGRSLVVLSDTTTNDFYVAFLWRNASPKRQ